VTQEDMLVAYRRHLAAEQESHDARAAAAEYVDDGYYELVAFGTRLRGRDAVERNYAATMHAMPDVHFDIDGEVIDGDTLVHWGTMIGTVTGSYLGHPPTGREVRLPFLARFEFTDGAIRSEQLWFDAATLCEQAGIASAAAQRYVRTGAASRTKD
jgi:steroid delta-isomerase-like uncharacterized protein